MNKICVMFCGQGSQFPGMGEGLVKSYACARRVFECGSDILGFDLMKTCFESDEAALGATLCAQPAIYAVSVAGYAVLRELLGQDASAVCGHSLGEYGALTAAGAYTLEDGFRVIRARAQAMDKAASQTQGEMAAIIGSNEETVRRVCEETPGYVLPVNYNSPQQTVIAGEAQAVKAASGVFLGMGLKAVRLAVSGAFHTKLMQPAADAFKEEISSIPYAQPRIPFYSNVTGQQLDHFDSLPDYLCQHMVSPVLFTSEIAAVADSGCEAFIEAGPGKVLGGLVRRTFKGVKPLSLQDEKELEKVRAALSL